MKMNIEHHLYGQVYHWGAQCFLVSWKSIHVCPVREVSILIASVSSEGSGESKNGRLRPNILVTFCSNRNTLTFDSKVYIWNNLSGVKCIVIHVVSPLPLVGAHTKICPKYWKSTFVAANNDLFTKNVSKTHMLDTMTSQFYEWPRSSMKKACSDHWLFWSHDKSAELALVPCSKLYHLIIHTGWGTYFDLWETKWMD